MTSREQLAKLMWLEDLRTRQLAAIRERIMVALVDDMPEDVESARRIGALAESKPVDRMSRPSTGDKMFPQPCYRTGMSGHSDWRSGNACIPRKAGSERPIFENWWTGSKSEKMRSEFQAVRQHWQKTLFPRQI